VRTSDLIHDVEEVVISYPTIWLEELKKNHDRSVRIVTLHSVSWKSFENDIKFTTVTPTTKLECNPAVYRTNTCMAALFYKTCIEIS
jgi:hypothetical protein